MNSLTIEICPETGIGSIVRETGGKVDLMPDEVKQLRETDGIPERLRAIIAEIDGTFAAALTPAEITQIARRFAGPTCGCSRN